MISEGESNLVLHRQGFGQIERSFDRIMELVGDLHDTYGQGKRGGYWADGPGAMVACRGIIVEASSIRAQIMSARKYNESLFPDQALSDFYPPWEPTQQGDGPTAPAAGQDGRADRQHGAHGRDRQSHRPRGSR